MSYRETPSIASLATGLGVSHAHLTRQFKRELGMTPMAYRHALRSSEAAGGKRSATLNKVAVAVARRLAESKDAAPRWVGKDALRELAGPAVQARLARRAPRGA